MGILKMAEDKLVQRDTIREQLGRLGMDVLFPEEKTPKGQKVKSKDKKEPRKVVKSSKKYQKVTKTRQLPQKQKVQKSASPSGAKFFEFIENLTK